MKTILIIAGSDSYGGAGIQADIKTSEAYGVYSATVVTAVTAQNTLGVTAVQAFDKEFLKEQFKQVVSDLKIDAVKIGMLGTKEIILCVKELLGELNCPIVLDPVAVSRAGSKLLDDEAIESLKSLFPLATVITPNRFETKLFFNLQTVDEVSLKTIQSDLNINVKNIYPDSEKSVDILLTKEALKKYEVSMGDKANTHGTGCSFSTAIACNLALGKSLDEAIGDSKNYILEAIKKAPKFGAGNGPIKHCVRRES